MLSLIVAGHRRRQRLARRHAAVVDEADDAILVDRHVDRLAHLDIVEGRLRDIHRHIAGMQLVALGDQVLVGRIGHDLGELRRRNAVADDIDLAVLEPQHGDCRILAEFEGELVEIGHALRGK